MTRLEEIAERDDDPIGPQYVKRLISIIAVQCSAGYSRLATAVCNAVRV